MACIRYRPRARKGKPWVLDYRDQFGRRRWKSCRTKAEAEDELAKVVPLSRVRHRPSVSPDVTLTDYAERWLTSSPGLKPQSIERYRSILELHVLPDLGALQVRKISRGDVRTLLANRLASGLAPGSVRIVYATLRALLTRAVEDEILLANPAAGAGKTLRLSSGRPETEKVMAFDREQLHRFLAAAGRRTPEIADLWGLMARTGLRLGEALALQWGDVDLEAASLRVSRSVTPKGVASTPKSGHGRSVDLGAAAVALLRARRAEASSRGLATGAGGPSAWIFPSPADPKRPARRRPIQAGFKLALRAAGLADHYTAHSLRHTYASILLAEGISLVYVQEQLGHANIQLTVGTYGRWLKKKAPGALDLLEEHPSKIRADVMVANSGVSGSTASEGTPAPRSEDAEAARDPDASPDRRNRTPAVRLVLESDQRSARNSAINASPERPDDPGDGGSE